jgi:four helix bundle protein
MKTNNILSEKSFAFAVQTVNLYKFLTESKKEYVLSKQFLRSGTAIGALNREAQQAESRADFIHKLSIALKELNESEYWLLLLKETNFLKPDEFDPIHKDCTELFRLITSIIKTSKNNRQLNN